VTDIETFIRGMPKAELHVHIEGTIEPPMMFALAERNRVELPWRSPEALEGAFAFDDLQSFLDIYFAGCRVMVQGQDFYDVTKAYLRRAHADNVVRAEVFLGPQGFTDRTPLAEIMEAVLHAIDDAGQDCGIRGGLIVSTHRHRPEKDAFALLDSIMPWRERIIGIGMGGPERPNPPSKFTRYFQECRRRGLRTTIHAGEEGPAEYVRQAVEVLAVDRIDHGNAALSDQALVSLLAERQIPLTVCPVSNVKLKVVNELADHPLRRMLAAGLNVSLHSDDPPYFGAYINENYVQCQKALGLPLDQIVTLARNSLTSSWATQSEMSDQLSRLERYVAENVPCDAARAATPHAICGR